MFNAQEIPNGALCVRGESGGDERLGGVSDLCVRGETGGEPRGPPHNCGESVSGLGNVAAGGGVGHSNGQVPGRFGRSFVNRFTARRVRFDDLTVREGVRVNIDTQKMAKSVSETEGACGDCDHDLVRGGGVCGERLANVEAAADRRLDSFKAQKLTLGDLCASGGVDTSVSENGLSTSVRAALGTSESLSGDSRGDERLLGVSDMSVRGDLGEQPTRHDWNERESFKQECQKWLSEQFDKAGPSKRVGVSTRDGVPAVDMRSVVATARFLGLQYARYLRHERQYSDHGEGDDAPSSDVSSLCKPPRHPDQLETRSEFSKVPLTQLGTLPILRALAGTQGLGD